MADTHVGITVGNALPSGAMVVQFWLKLGEMAVTLGVGEEKEVERIPEQLKRFL